MSDPDEYPIIGRVAVVDGMTVVVTNDLPNASVRINSRLRTYTMYQTNDPVTSEYLGTIPRTEAEFVVEEIRERLILCRLVPVQWGDRLLRSKPGGIQIGRPVIGYLEWRGENA